MRQTNLRPVRGVRAVLMDLAFFRFVDPGLEAQALRASGSQTPRAKGLFGPTVENTTRPVGAVPQRMV